MENSWSTCDGENETETQEIRNDIVSNGNSKIEPPRIYLFKDPAFRIRFLQTLLILSVILWSIAVYSDFLELKLLNDIKQGLFSSEEELAITANASDTRQMILGLGQGILALTSFIFFMMWVHRSNNNIRALTEESMEYTPGWAVGWFFIPICALYKPYFVIKEIWIMCSKHSNLKRFSVVGLWWTFWLISSCLSKLSTKLQLKAEDIDELITASFMSTISGGIDIFAKILMFMLISKIFLMQQEIRKQQMLNPTILP